MLIMRAGASYEYEFALVARERRDAQQFIVPLSTGFLLSASSKRQRDLGQNRERLDTRK